MNATGHIAQERRVPLSTILEATTHGPVAGAGSPDGEVCMLTCDSRDAGRGAAFFAIRGLKADGHRFIGDALSRGASYVFCEELPMEADSTAALFIQVPDSRKALAEAARAFYANAADRLRIVGVTGTNGKTTTARLIAGMLTANGIPSGYIGTGMALIGSRQVSLERTTPEAHLLHGLFSEMLREGCQAVVMEVSSHAMALERVHGIGFDAAIFTNLTVDHLDFHGTIDAYAAAKQQLFDRLRPLGVGIVNIDDPRGAQMAGHLEPRQRICCSMEVPDTFFSDACRTRLQARMLEGSAEGSVVAIDFPEGSLMMESRLAGAFNVMNLLEAAALGYAFGLPRDAVCGALSEVPPVEGRMERIQAGGASVFIDYAHTPDALEKVLTTLRPLVAKGGRLFVLFGCGGQRDRSKRPEMGRIAAGLADEVILTSDNPRGEDPGVIIDEIESGMRRSAHRRLDDRAEAIRLAVSMLLPGDILLVAGKGNEDYQEVRGCKLHFSDREAVRDAIGALLAAQSPYEEN